MKPQTFESVKNLIDKFYQERHPKSRHILAHDVLDATVKFLSKGVELSPDEFVEDWHNNSFLLDKAWIPLSREDAATYYEVLEQEQQRLEEAAASLDKS